MARFEGLGRSVQSALAEGPGDRRLAAQRRALLRQVQRRQKRRSKQRLVWAGAVGAALATAALAFFFFFPAQRDAHPVTLADGTSLTQGRRFAAASQGAELHFSEGSLIQLHPGTEVRVQTSEINQVTVTLAEGHLRANVHKGTGNQWQYLAGEYLIRITGTQLEINWEKDSRHLSLRVHRGAVKVTGGTLADDVVVQAGSLFTADDHISSLTRFNIPRPPAVEAGGPASTPAAREQPPSAPAPEATPTPRRRDRRNKPPLSNRWKALAAAGDYAGAVAVARRQTIGAILTRAPAEDVLLLADAARLSRQYALARRVLLSIRQRFSGKEPASLAAFRLGRLAFDHLQDYHAAARWFRRSVADAPQNALAPEARGRLILSLQAAGDLAGARKAAEQYLRLYPRGTYHTTAKSLLSETTQK